MGVTERFGCTPGDQVPTAIDAVTQAWHVVAEALGTTATAALMRRAARRAACTIPEVQSFRVEGAGYAYGLEVPSSWRTSDPAAGVAARALLAELCELLTDLTGDVVTARLAQSPATSPYLPPTVLTRINGNATNS